MNSETVSRLQIIPLGGLEQIGMNMTAFKYEDSTSLSESEYLVFFTSAIMLSP